MSFEIENGENEEKDKEDIDQQNFSIVEEIEKDKRKEANKHAD